MGPEVPTLNLFHHLGSFCADMDVEQGWHARACGAKCSLLPACMQPVKSNQTWATWLGGFECLGKHTADGNQSQSIPVNGPHWRKEFKNQLQTAMRFSQIRQVLKLFPNYFLALFFCLFFGNLPPVPAGTELTTLSLVLPVSRLFFAQT